MPENELFRERLKKPHGFIRLRFEDDSAVDAAPAGQVQAKYGKDRQGLGVEKNIPAISEVFVGDATSVFSIQGRVRNSLIACIFGLADPRSRSTFKDQHANYTRPERFALTLQNGSKFWVSLKGTQFRQGDVRYESRFVRDGRKVTVHRMLRVQRASNVCGVKENRDWLAFYKVLQRDLRSQIIYR